MEPCKNNNIVYIHELLKWHNNLDVEPMLQACLKQKEFIYTFKLDMYKDGYSSPALSENIMYQFSVKGFDEFLGITIPLQNCNIPTICPSDVFKKMTAYKKQDVDANRSTDDFITDKEDIDLLGEYNYRCVHCHIPFNHTN